MIETVRFIGEINKKDGVMQCHTQSGNITNNLKVKIDLTLPELSAKTIVTWNCHVDEPSNGRYEMILGRYLLTALLLNPNDLNTSSKQMVYL